ncbi:hypothetical protein F4824DRAFT_495801 [Ustulina deusta]|nr:hypothetical protein F4824DRAFT_495801 [Ustulina deusta]
MNSTKPKRRRGPPKRNYMKEQEGVEIDPSIINNKRVLKNVEDCTEDGYVRQLRNWDDFVAEFGPRTVESLGDLKEYIYRMGRRMRHDKKPEDTLPQNGLKAYWKKFTAGYQRERGKIPAEHITMITYAIAPRGQIGKLLNMVPDKGPRKHATAAVLIWVGEYLWSLDWKTFKRPCLRVDLWACLSLAAYTAARVSDYIESSARTGTQVGLYYKDTTFILFKNELGNPEFALQSTKFLKGKHPLSSKLPTPNIHEGGTFARQPLYMNPILFFLAIFCSKGALRDYRGAEGLSRLLDLKVGPGQSQVLIHWDLSVLDQPIFSGPSGNILTAKAFSKELREVEIRAGFPDPPSLHCYRAEGLTNVDSNPMYSDTQRQRLAGHDNNHIHQQYYASRNPGIDSQAAYLGVQARGINIGELFRNLEVRWEASLWQSLPAAKLQELRQTEEYQEVEAQISAMSAGKRVRRLGASPTAPTVEVKGPDLSSSESDGVLAHPDRKLRRDLRAIEQKALGKFWKEISTQAQVGSQSYVCKGVDYPFSRLRPVLPSCRRLADLLLTDASLRSPAGRAALDALIDLYSSETEVHRPGLDRSNCSCRKSKSTQEHVYECKKRSSPFAEFCFFCNEWFTDSHTWEEHCRCHLEQDPLPVELAWAKVESTFLPGHCPFCLWDSRLAAATRLYQFHCPLKWEEHIRAHDIAWLEQCPDKRCCTRGCDAQSFSRHMYDVHRIPLRLFGAAGRSSSKRGASAESQGGSPAKKIKTEEDISAEATFVLECYP